MTLDAKARSLADKLFTKFGKSITLTSIVEGAYDPATGEMSGGTSTTTTHLALIKDFTLLRGFKSVDPVDGGIQAGDRQATIAALNVTAPQPADKVTIDSEVYQVIAVRNVWSGELPAFFEMQVRK